MSWPIVVVRVNPAKTLSIANNTNPAIKDQQATERRSYPAKVSPSAVQSNAPANAIMKATSMFQRFPLIWDTASSSHFRSSPNNSSHYGIRTGLITDGREFVKKIGGR
jgi:hypothetical protein